MIYFKKLLFILGLAVLCSHTVCFAQGQITIGSKGANLYSHKPYSFQISDPAVEPVINIPAGTALTILEEATFPAMPVMVKAYKVSYSGQIGWILEGETAEGELSKQNAQNKRQKDQRIRESFGKINNATTEEDIRQWFGEPKSVTIDEVDAGIKTLVYEFSLEIPEGDCWEGYTLSVVIDTKTGKVIKHGNKNQLNNRSMWCN